MKKILNFSFFIFSFSLLFASCTQGVPGGGDDEGYGTLDLGSITHSVAATRGVIDVNTADYTVKVWRVRGANETEVVSTTYGECTGTIPLPAGSYRLEVASPNPLPAAFDAPWYVGGTPFTISKGATTPIGNIVCTLGNVKVTVRYSEALQALLDPGRPPLVTVSAGENNLEYPYGELSGGYFGAAAPVTLTVSCEGVIDGEPTTFSGTVTASPGQWRRIRLSTEEADGERTFHIMVFDSEAGQIGTGDEWF